jgi:type I site-specific restriction-modification system R (restriction) subunit
MSEVDLSSPEVKKAIEAAVNAAVAPLVEKRDELLNEVKTLRKGTAIKPEDLEKVEAERDEYKAKLDAANKDVKKLTTERDTAVTNLAKESELSANAHKERELTESLAALNVSNPIALKAAKALLSSQTQVVIEGDKRVTKVGDKLLADHLKEWAATDEGKHFITAPANGGGGANGGSGNGGGSKTMTRAEFDQKTPAERMAFSKDGGTVTT